MQFEPVIGLEIHVQPKTRSKMFCRCRSDIFGAEPNSHVCPVCLGLPGALPVINKNAVERTILLGLALNCQIAQVSKFDRKNYFYPDLPKGYQISQYDGPLATGGSLKLKIKNEKLKIIRIRRVHLEEDTGKISHKKNYSLIDFNRSGIPLIEVVTEPDLRSAQEVGQFLRELQILIKQLGISQAEMAKGTMRLEPNISVIKLKMKNEKLKITEDDYPDYKVEIKNINSFKFVERAVDYEIERQIKLIKAGKKIKQETRGWDEKKQITILQRRKEEAQDYRYFPEPDLPPLRISKDWIKEINKSMPELPRQREKRYADKFRLDEKYVKILVKNKALAKYLEEAVEAGLPAKKVADLIINRPDIRNIPPKKLKEYLEKKDEDTISDRQYILKLVNKVLAQNLTVVKDIKKGKETAIKFLIGQAMKESGGKADPKHVSRVIVEKFKRK